MGAITGLATATASDRAAITQLTATFTRLMSEIATVNKKLVSVLQASRISHGSRVGRDKTTRRREARAGVGARSGATTRTGTGPPTLTETAVGVDLDPLIHYCWTCGPGCRHNSSKCIKLAVGNINSATKRDIQGGTEALQ